jgi:phospholipase C
MRRSGAVHLFAPLAIFSGLLVGATASASAADATATPIEHVIVLFQENISFDHYFATYPVAANGPGETPFHAAPGSPTVDGLTDALLNHNPNKANPFRLSPKQAATCDMDHDYMPEQQAFDGGLMDKFVEYTSPYPGSTGCGPNDCHGLLRRKHGDRAMELRSALRHER